MRFKTLVELFDKTADYKWVEKNNKVWSGEFNIGSGEGRTVRLIIGREGDDPWTILFNSVNTKRNKLIMMKMKSGKVMDGFSVDDVIGSMEITGKGDEFLVIGTIKKMVKEWLTKVKPEELNFTAKEASRQKLYNRFAKEITSGGYELTLGKEDGNKKYSFVRK